MADQKLTALSAIVAPVATDLLYAVHDPGGSPVSGKITFGDLLALGGNLLTTGATAGATSQAQAFTNGILGPSWKPSADSATALQLQNAAGAVVLNVDTTDGRVSVGAADSTARMVVSGGTGASDDKGLRVVGTYSTNTAHPMCVETVHPLADGKAVAAFDAKLSVSGAAAADHMAAFQARIDFASSGSLSDLYDFFAAGDISGTGTVTNRYGLHVGNVSPLAGTLTNHYGVYVADLTAGTNKWAFYAAGDQPSFHAGKLILGGTAVVPTRKLTVWGDVFIGDAGDGLVLRESGNVAQILGISNAGDAYNDLHIMANDAGIMLKTTGLNGVGTIDPAAKFHIDQASTTAAVPVLTLDQADVSEEFIRFIGTSYTNASRSLVDAVDLPTPGAIAGWLKVYVQDDLATNPITAGAYFVPFYTIPTA